MAKLPIRRSRTCTGAAAAAAARAALLAAAVLGAACGSGGDDSGTAAGPAVVARNDTLTLDAGESASLLANDTVGDQLARAGADGNVWFAASGAALPAGVQLDEGRISVTQQARAGRYELAYQICQAGNSGNCATAGVSLTVPRGAIAAGADTFTLASGTAADVLFNDTLSGGAASGVRVQALQAGTWPAGLSLAPNGVLSNTGAAAGRHDLLYRVCQLVAPDNCSSDTALTVIVPAVGSLTGRVIDADTTLPLAGVLVTVDGQQSTFTDASGAYGFASLPQSGRTAVSFSTGSHAASTRIATIGTGFTDVQAHLSRTALVNELDIRGATTLAPVSATMVSSSAQVDFDDAQAMQLAADTGGGAVPGLLRVRLTPIDAAADSSASPGDFTAAAAAGDRSVESFGQLEIRVTNLAGDELGLRAGKRVNLRIPMNTRDLVAPATSLTAFEFDFARGKWVPRPQVVTGPFLPPSGEFLHRYFLVEGVDRLGTWMVGRLLDVSADPASLGVVFTGCVKDGESNLEGARVFADGTTYSSTHSAISGSTADPNGPAPGQFRVVVRKNSAAIVSASASGRVTNAKRVVSLDSDFALTAASDCLVLTDAGMGASIKLTWAGSFTDMDGHLLLPDGNHVYWIQKQGDLLSPAYATQDVDDFGYGPEIITISRLLVGRYRYYVHKFSEPSPTPLGASRARVELALPGRVPQLLVVPSLGDADANRYWDVFAFDVDENCNITLIPTSAQVSAAPQPPSRTTGLACRRN